MQGAAGVARVGGAMPQPADRQYRGSNPRPSLAAAIPHPTAPAPHPPRDAVSNKHEPLVGQALRRLCVAEPLQRAAAHRQAVHGAVGHAPLHVPWLQQGVEQAGRQRRRARARCCCWFCTPACCCPCCRCDCRFTAWQLWRCMRQRCLPGGGSSAHRLLLSRRCWPLLSSCCGCCCPALWHRSRTCRRRGLCCCRCNTTAPGCCCCCRCWHVCRWRIGDRAGGCSHHACCPHSPRSRVPSGRPCCPLMARVVAHKLALHHAQEKSGTRVSQRLAVGGSRQAPFGSGAAAGERQR